jgi:hypothetical protein
MLLLLAAALPSLFWDGGASTAPALKENQISRIAVPAASLDSWKAVAGVAAEAADPSGAIKLLKPAVNYRPDQASASTAPWVDSNGWRFLRDPGGRFYYDAPGESAALAAAEAYVYGVQALVHTDTNGLKPFTQIIAFLKSLPEASPHPLVNIGYEDDGSAQSGELMNLLVRRNLLFRLVSTPDPKLNITVAFGSSAYPKTEKDPSVLAQLVRSSLTDDKRLVRIYGSEVVIARLTGGGERVRVHLLNYAATSRPVLGLRVSVEGKYPHHRIYAYRVPDAKLLDFDPAAAGRTEFTIPNLREYTVIDLSR